MAEEIKEFTPITTQEEFNEAIKGRIARVTAKFADYDELKSYRAEAEEKFAAAATANEETAAKIAEYEKTIAEQNDRIKTMATASLKTGIALEMGLPYEMAARLTGETEEEIRSDAEKMSALFAARTPAAPAAPLRNTEAKKEEDGVLAAFKKLNPNISI